MNGILGGCIFFGLVQHTRVVACSNAPTLMSTNGTHRRLTLHLGEGDNTSVVYAVRERLVPRGYIQCDVLYTSSSSSSSSTGSATQGPWRVFVPPLGSTTAAGISPWIAAREQSQLALRLWPCRPLSATGPNTCPSKYRSLTANGKHEGKKTPLPLSAVLTCRESSWQVRTPPLACWSQHLPSGSRSRSPPPRGSCARRSAPPCRRRCRCARRTVPGSGRQQWKQKLA